MEVDVAILRRSPLLQDDIPDHDVLPTDRERGGLGCAGLELLDLLEASKLEFGLALVLGELDVLEGSRELVRPMQCETG